MMASIAFIAASVVPAMAGKTTPTKPYVATIAPDAVPAGASVSFTLTLQNLSDQQQIGSVNLSPPTGFVLTSESSPVATIAGNVLQLRSLSLLAGSSITVPFTGDVPCASGGSDWTIHVKQSNDFNGPPGNDFVMVAPSDLSTPVSGTCHLGFVTGAQPQDAETDAVISRVDLTPGGGAVEVEVLDGANQRVTSANATITLAVDPTSADPGTFTLGGTKVVPAVAGVAAFGDLTLGATGRYKLLATSPGLTSAASDEFRIWDDGAICVPGVECVATETGQFMRGEVRTTSNTPGMLLLNLDGDELDCGDNFRHAPQTMTFDAPGVTTPDGKLVTMTIDKREVNREANNGAAHYQVCFEGESPFLTRDGTMATLGLLPDCASQDPAAPCVRSKVKDRAGNVVITLVVPAGDPRCQ